MSSALLIALQIDRLYARLARGSAKLHESGFDIVISTSKYTYSSTPVLISTETNNSL